MKLKKLKPRLPVGVVQKLSDNTGGGTHKKQKGKGSYRRKQKHGSRNSEEETSSSSLYQVRETIRELVENVL